MRTSLVHRMTGISVLAILLGLSVTIPLAHAQSDQTNAEPVQAAQTAATTYLISFQGRLLTPGTGVPKPDTLYAMTFAIYDVSGGGAALWSESKNVLVSNGTFSTLFGDTTPLVPGAFNGQDLWLGIAVGGEELLPRQRLAYTPYSLYAASAGNAATLAGNAPGAFAAASHAHDGGAITSGVVSEPHIDPAITRDGEVVPIVSGSGAFAPTSHNHMGETWSGSTPLLMSNGTFASALDASSVGPAITVASSSADGIQVSSASDDGIQVTQANYGLYVVNANSIALLVSNAGAVGLNISKTGADGIKISTAGTPTGAAISSAANNGIEIENAQGSGVFVGHSNGDGVHVEEGGVNGGYFRTLITNGTGVYGIATNGSDAYGVWGQSPGGRGVVGSTSTGYAGYFFGKVHVAGTLTKSGGAFKIDHPLDPANKYLYHSFVESPDMKNIYDGVVTLDANGKATVQLPEWFEALNEGFRYQLTCIGGYAPVYIAEEVKNNQFKIAGGAAGLKVSWQVTGIRHDPYAEANRIVVEEIKSPEEQGRYLFPAGYGQDRSLTPALLLEKPMPQQPVIVNHAEEGVQSDPAKP